MRDINEVAKKMAKNGFKTAKSLGCAFHFESEFRYSSFVVILTVVIGKLLLIGKEIGIEYLYLLIILDSLKKYTFRY